MAELDAPPLPTGDPGRLRTLAARLRYGADQGTQTAVAQQAGGVVEDGAWSGPAADAARAEAAAAARLTHEVCGRVGPVAAAVDGFASDLDAARRTVESIREEWLAADRALAGALHDPVTATSDPVLAARSVSAAESDRSRVRADLLARHAGCLRELAAAEARAATTIIAALGEAISPTGERLLLLSQLPMTQSAALQADAAALVDAALAGRESDATLWTLTDIQGVLVALGGSLDDPMVASALLDRVGPSGLSAMTQTLWLAGGDPRPGLLPGERESAQAALEALASAFVGSTADAPNGDLEHPALAEEWRQGWIASLLGQPVAGLTAQAALVATAGAGGRLPGQAYLSGAFAALLTRRPVWPLDLQQQSDGGYFARKRRPMPDPVAALLGALGADPPLARRTLLAPGTFGPTLVADLVVHQPLSAAGSPARLESSAALGRLLLDLAHAADPGGADQAALSRAFLESVTDAGVRWWELDGHESVNVSRHLDPLRWPAAVLLSADPAALWSGSEAAAHGGNEGSARLRVLLGEIARDPNPETGTPFPRALSVVLATSAAFHADQLGQALAAHGPNAPEVARAQAQLGYVIGFTAGSATESLIHAGDAQDSVNETQRTAVHHLSALVGVLPVPGGHPLVAAAGALLSPAADLAVEAFDAAHPVDNADRAEAGGGVLVAEGAALASASVRAVVSSSAGWESYPFLASEAARVAVESGRMAAFTADPARHRAR